MTDWKSRYDSLQQINESVVRQRNKLKGRVKYLEQYVEELEAQLNSTRRHHGNMAQKRAQRAAEALFRGSLVGE